MTIPADEWRLLRVAAERMVNHVALMGSVPQTIEALAILDGLRKRLDRVQANPHLMSARAAAMPPQYVGVEERARRAERERSDLSHAQDTYPADGPTPDLPADGLRPAPPPG